MSFLATYFLNGERKYISVKTVEDLVENKIYDSKHHIPNYVAIFGEDEKKSKELAVKLVIDFFKIICYDCVHSFSQFLSPVKTFRFCIYVKEQQRDYDPVFKGTKPFLHFDCDYDYFKNYYSKDYEFKSTIRYMNACFLNVKKGLRYLTQKIEKV